jgi:hypothetical protein
MTVSRAAIEAALQPGGYGVTSLTVATPLPGGT